MKTKLLLPFFLIVSLPVIAMANDASDATIRFNDEIRQPLSPKTSMSSTVTFDQVENDFGQSDALTRTHTNVTRITHRETMHQQAGMHEPATAGPSKPLDW
ncbi:hypothetical protein SAMN02745148_03641 [Modicisalibacter ilicicola DSM 19980]|uniref:Uncharacterized protein n=1 Tax=Modicisalibacter ilicicola DSM 19980 TaxID=1121942 RepID=A0A1M5EVQ4_9GAMM|nr:hypothetical protein [Halomonas ilicicola]SHF83325.1 hypothetical protein SAMN02745148_03641 [Halomonas ilicicola DSM 19980]